MLLKTESRSVMHHVNQKKNESGFAEQLSADYLRRWKIARFSKISQRKTNASDFVVENKYECIELWDWHNLKMDNAERDLCNLPALERHVSALVVGNSRSPYSNKGHILHGLHQEREDDGCDVRHLCTHPDPTVPSCIALVPPQTEIEEDIMSVFN